MVRKSKQNHKDRKTEAKREDSLANKIVKRLFIGIIGLVVLLGLIVMFNVFVGGFGKSNDEAIAIEVPTGSTTKDVATTLEEKDIISNASLFKLYLRLTGNTDIQAGHYEIPKDSGFSKTSKILAEGSQSGETYSLVIPEGSNLEDIAEIVGNSSTYSADEFMDVATDDAYFNELLEKYPDMLEEVSQKDDVRYKLEGYLFPATYEIGADETVEQIIDKMVAQMNQIYVNHQDQVSQSDFSFHELLSLASLVEAEAPATDDRKMIAGVFINRLNSGMPIQSDISISYALNEHRAYVTNEDTQVDSPYNLYLNSGLGPGPFNSPGLEAIEAVLAPESSNYLYFVADLKTGKVYYAETYEEHLKLVDQYVSEENADM